MRHHLKRGGLTAAFIGYRNHAARVIRAARDCGLAGRPIVFHPEDRGAEVLALHGPGVEFTTDWRRVLAADAAFVLAPNSTHYSYLRRLLTGSTSRVYCEKPPAASVREASALLALPVALKRRVHFNFNFRNTRLARALADRPARRGRLLSVDIVHTHGLAFKKGYASSWRGHRSEHRLGVLETVGIHYLDLIDGLVSPIKDLRSTLLNGSGRGNSADTAFCDFTLRDGARGRLFCSYAAPFQRELRLTYTDAVFKAGPGGVTVHAPRDSFDAAGRFAPPPVRRERFDLSRDIEDSLGLSVRAFLSAARKPAPFLPRDFDQKASLDARLLASIS